MKTIKEWLEELPTEIKEKAFYNVIKDNINLEVVLKYNTITIKEALLGAFNWDNTNEGRDYWTDIYNKL